MIISEYTQLIIYMLVLGYFGYRTNQLDGQTVKTRDVYRLFKEQFPYEKLEYFDTQDFKYSKLSPFRMIWKVVRSKTLIYLPANSNLRYIFPVLFVFSNIFRFKIHYYVVGGWLYGYIKDMPLHKWMLKRIEGIHVETNLLKDDLTQKLNFNNVDIFPNFRFFNFNPHRTSSPTLRLVFMARIMKEKGLDWIFNLAEYIKTHKLNNKISITFYGQINENDRSYFEDELQKFEFVSYQGALDPSEIYKTLSKYDILILPTHFYTEGLPGSIVDAYISGLPVIATEWIHSKEFIEDGKSGFIIPFYDGQQPLIDKVMLFNNDRELLERMHNYVIKKREMFAPPTINL